MFHRINSARAALGLPRQRPDAPKREFTSEDWEAWNNGTWQQRLDEKKAEHERRIALGPAADAKRHTRDTTWGNDDGMGCFVAGFSEEIDELMLQAYMERVGVVRFVKIFTDSATGKSKMCGKVFYEDAETATRAIQGLHKTMFNGQPLRVQMLGQSDNPKKRKKEPARSTADGSVVECPRILPHFEPTDTDEQKMDLSFAAFEDLVQNHDAESTGMGMVFMARNFVREINSLFEGKPETTYAMWARLNKHPWFWDNYQQCRWQASKSIICISNKTTNWELKKGKGKGDGTMGKGDGMMPAMPQALQDVPGMFAPSPVQWGTPGWGC